MVSQVDFYEYPRLVEAKCVRGSNRCSICTLPHKHLARIKNTIFFLGDFPLLYINDTFLLFLFQTKYRATNSIYSIYVSTPFRCPHLDMHLIRRWQPHPKCSSIFSLEIAFTASSCNESEFPPFCFSCSLSLSPHPGLIARVTKQPPMKAAINNTTTITVVIAMRFLPLRRLFRSSCGLRAASSSPLTRLNSTLSAISCWDTRACKLQCFGTVPH